MMAPLLADAPLIDWHTFLFVLFALVACVFAAGVVFSNNIVRMAFYLTLSLGATSGLFFLAGAEFVGAMQLLIYVGGTLVLLIFGVMLTARDAFISMKTRPGDWVLGVLVGGSLLALLLFAAFTVDAWQPPENWAEQRAKLSPADTQDTTRIGVALVGGRIDKQDPEQASLADGLSGYLLPFEIVSVHLLVVLIGAGYLARARRQRAGAAAAARTEVPPKRRVIFPTVVLAFLLLNDAVGAAPLIYSLVRPTEASAQLAALQAPEWLLTVMALLVTVRALCLAALLCWQKWGFAGVVVTSVALPVVLAVALKDSDFALLMFGIAGATLAINLLIVGAIYLLLTRLGRPTTWAQLE
jgi:NADH:ubiquinone oxidoreductase subunit 6 (subunit J)